MELREIEQESKEQDDRSTDMAREVEDHKSRMEQLEQAVSALKEAQSAVDSEGLQSALQEAEQAKQATEERLDDLRDQKAEMVQRNAEMEEQCRQAIDRKREALQKLPFLRQGMRSADADADVAASFYAKMDTALQEDVNRTTFAHQEIQSVRERLDALEI